MNEDSRRQVTWGTIVAWLILGLIVWTLLGLIVWLGVTAWGAIL